MFTHNLDPVLFNIGLISIRWYSLAYIFGILIGWWYGRFILTRRFNYNGTKFNLKLFDDLITYLIISIILGGRLGYIIFYNLEFYINNPIDILKIWEGGMSFHGALLGIIIGTIIFAKKNKLRMKRRQLPGGSEPCGVDSRVGPQTQGSPSGPLEPTPVGILPTSPGLA